MKKVSTKSLMVIALVVASFTATPMMVAGYDYDDDYTYDQIGITDPTALIGGFGSIFGMMFRSLGPGGNVLATVFEMLFMETLTDFSGKEILPGVYAISATQENNYSDKLRDFSTPRKQYYPVPLDYIEGPYNISKYGYPYLEVETFGDYQYNLTVGAGVTLIIWDNDGSFVNAVKKIIDFFTEIQPYLSSPLSSSSTSPSTSSISGLPPDDLIQKGVELITWFLIHINDIFTGEELFVLNPITWQKLEIQTGAGFSMSKTWKVTGDDGRDEFDETLEIAVPDAITLLKTWNITAQFRSDSYMEWLLSEAEVVINLKQEFTSFTFDLFQLWVKNFEIHIDVAEILKLLGGGGSSVIPAAIFQGLDIEFFLFTHHLTGAFLYNDTATGPIPDGKLSVNYTQVTDNVGDPVFDSMGDPVEVPRSSEITHKLMLGAVNDFNFTKPTKDGNKVSWGLTLDNATLTPVPLGVDLDSYLGATDESLAYIHFGFTFEPEEMNLPTTDGGTVPVLHGAVKLDQFFAPWNGPSAPGANNPIVGLDLAIIYVSTVLHFHLKIDTIGDEPTARLNPADDYDETTHSLKIGNYLPHNIRDKLDFVDIAGPEYLYGSEVTKMRENASTSILPVALFEVEANAHQTFEGTPDQVDTFAADIGLNISFSVMVYAVCFPEFEDGSGIWHDPVFSVFMVFEATGFWALILLVAGVGLLGVATILIKRRKDSRF